MFRTKTRFTYALTALALAAVACSGASGVSSQRVQKADVRVLPGGGVHPLTGVSAFGDAPWRQRSPLAVKIGNSPAERPQAGIDRADLVYEEIVEGGVTRFMAVFSTNSAARVGPVRSVRSVDPDLAQPLGALVAGSGGVLPVLTDLRNTPGVTDIGAKTNGDLYRRDSNRRAPYNLYTATDTVWNGRQGSPPGPQFEFLSTADDPTTGATETANEVGLSFSSTAGPVRFVFDKDSGLYKRFLGSAQHIVEGTDGLTQLGFRNVIVQQVATHLNGTVDRAGQRSIDINVLGEGSAVIFRGGRAVRGRWVRSSASEPTRFVDGSGQVMRLAPGTTIVELLPQGRDVSVS
jgi:hypothetical protein